MRYGMCAGCMAALSAEHFLQEQTNVQPNTASHWGTEAEATGKA